MLDTSKTAPSVDAWLRQAKADPAAAECGMYLTHNGVVRTTPKAEARGVETDGVAPGRKVGGMLFSYDAARFRLLSKTPLLCLASAMCASGLQMVNLR